MNEHQTFQKVLPTRQRGPNADSVAESEARGGRQALAYETLVERLAATPDRPQLLRDLGPLEHADVGAILASISEQVFIDALADSGVLCAVIAHFLSDSQTSRKERNELIGTAVIAALKDYLLPLLLIAVQAKWDVQRECDRSENPFPVSEA